MTVEQVEKANELSKSIASLSRCVKKLQDNDEYGAFDDYNFKNSCFIARYEVIEVFEKKLNELKKELSEL